MPVVEAIAGMQEKAECQPLTPAAGMLRLVRERVMRPADGRQGEMAVHWARMAAGARVRA